jgi:hypothetical protein
LQNHNLFSSYGWHSYEESANVEGLRDISRWWQPIADGGNIQMRVAAKRGVPARRVIRHLDAEAKLSNDHRGRPGQQDKAT